MKLDFPKKILIYASITHVLNDLYLAIFYPLLPFIAEDLELKYSQIGLIKTAVMGASSMLQFPAGLIADYMSEFWILSIGNLWVGIGLIGISITSTYYLLLVLSLVTGFGGGFQHPVASRLVSSIFNKNKQYTSIGILNFSGDIGKIIAPIVVSIIILRWGWQTCLLSVGLFGVSLIILTLLPIHRLIFIHKNQINVDKNNTQPPQMQGENSLFNFIKLMLAGSLDSVVRNTVLTFIPFLLISQGMDLKNTTSIFIIIYMGGALGKVFSGKLSDYFPPINVIVITKILTSFSLLAILFIDYKIAIFLVFFLGIGLNGTSSVFYGSVARVTDIKQRGKYFGIYYTATEGMGSISPLIFGIISDIFNIQVTIYLIFVICLSVIPISYKVNLKN
ncbi:MAG: hypothetical protein CL758_06795 [Chloroflexi bacterium]|nr:hypothetical protein [Chloroflexota bacterium]|tara:strand:+ start:6053 stop:7225 length:1173 start_codon:yes stop_codon:yes gene_type:complete